MSRLSGMQIWELMTDMRDNLILESVPPSWWAAKPTPITRMPLTGEAVAPRREKPARTKTPLLLWLAKGGWIAAVIGLLVAAGVTVGLFALRDGGSDDPQDSETESVTQGEDPAAAAADRLLSQLTATEEGLYLSMTTATDIRRIVETDGAAVGLREQHRATLVMAGHQFSLIRTPYLQDEETYLYDGEALYVHTADTETKSPADDGDMATLLSLLCGGDGQPIEFPRLSAADVFESITVNPADANGHITVVCTGLKPAAVQDLIGLLRLPLESLELVSPYTLDEEGNLLRDLKQAEDQCRALLLGLSAGSLTVTLTESSTGALRKLEVSADFDAALEGVEVEYEIDGRATFDYTRRHIAPLEGMGAYKQVHWRAVFDFLNAEAVGLVPNEDGVYCFAKGDRAAWEAQINYVITHPEEFEGKDFIITGYTWNVGGPFAGNVYRYLLHAHSQTNVNPHVIMQLTAEQFEHHKANLQSLNRPYCEMRGTFTAKDPSAPLFVVKELSFS